MIHLFDGETSFEEEFKSLISSCFLRVEYPVSPFDFALAFNSTTVRFSILLLEINYLIKIV
jgi:hypothetical protein